MHHLTTPAIVLRRRDYADFDLILTVLTRDYGKCTLIAKAAKKSTKRFPGSTLDPFSGLTIVYRQGRDAGISVLEEAVLEHSYGAIRSDIIKTAYASYWAELIALWLESGQTYTDLFHLLAFVLKELGQQKSSAVLLNILFQMRFVGQEGFRPVLERCSCCQTAIDHLEQQHFCIDLNLGGIVCRQCPTGSHGRMQLSKGTLKQLRWLAAEELSVAQRVRFSTQALAEATTFLETFVPYHIGKVPNSLAFLRKVRPAQPARPSSA